MTRRSILIFVSALCWTSIAKSQEPLVNRALVGHWVGQSQYLKNGSMQSEDPDLRVTAKGKNQLLFEYTFTKPTPGGFKKLFKFNSAKEQMERTEVGEPVGESFHTKGLAALAATGSGTFVAECKGNGPADKPQWTRITYTLSQNNFDYQIELSDDGKLFKTLSVWHFRRADLDPQH